MKARTIAFATLVILLTPPASLRAQELRVWGTNSSHQVSGAPDGNFRFGVSGATQIIAFRTDGTPVIWGGVGDPAGLPPASVALENDRFRDAAMGRSNAILIRRDRTLVAWNPNHILSQNVPAGTFRDVACANVHAVAIDKDTGALHAWGANGIGGVDLGLLNTPSGSFTAVAARVLYTVAVRKDGTLMGWGSPPFAMFASWSQTPEDPLNYYIPDQKYTAVAAGNTHSLAIRSDGKVEGWGDASGGAIDAPTHVSFNAVAAGVGFSVGLATNGMLWGWGTPGATPFPLPPGSWSFASVGWTRYGDTNWYFVPDERFRTVAAGAFQIVAVTGGRHGDDGDDGDDDDDGDSD